MYSSTLKLIIPQPEGLDFWLHYWLHVSKLNDVIPLPEVRKEAWGRLSSNFHTGPEELSIFMPGTFEQPILFESLVGHTVGDWSTLFPQRTVGSVYRTLASAAKERDYLISENIFKSLTSISENKRYLTIHEVLRVTLHPLVLHNDLTMVDIIFECFKPGEASLEVSEVQYKVTFSNGVPLNLTLSGEQLTRMKCSLGIREIVNLSTGEVCLTK